MPTYEFRCEAGHDFEHRCGISSKPDQLACPAHLVRYHFDMHEPVEGDSETWCEKCGGAPLICGKPAKQVFLTPPPIWIPGVTHQTVLDYPGSKAQKAGHVHSHGYKPATKVQSGYGGVTSTAFRHNDEVANWVKPDGSSGTTPGGST
jgi:predicted nucleic acid-binding Zn ribbon protein